MLVLACTRLQQTNVDVMLEVINPAVVVAVDGALGWVVLHIGRGDVRDFVVAASVGDIDFDGVATGNVSSLIAIVAEVLEDPVTFSSGVFDALLHFSSGDITWNRATVLEHIGGREARSHT